MAISHSPWLWLRSDATALAGYANMMMMILAPCPSCGAVLIIFSSLSFWQGGGENHREVYMRPPVTIYCLIISFSSSSSPVLQGSRRSGPTDLVTVRAAERLRQATTPRYHSLFTQISRLDNGVKFIASLRSDVIVSLKPSYSFVSCC